MKNLKAPFLVIAVLFLNVVLADTKDMPTPDNKDYTEMEDDDCDPCGGTPPDYPIDQNISFLLVGGLALGLFAIYKNQTKKASI